MRSSDFQDGVRHGYNLALNQCVGIAKRHFSPAIALRFEGHAVQLRVPDIAPFVPNRGGRQKKSGLNLGDAEAPAVSDYKGGDTAFEGDDESFIPRKHGLLGKNAGDIQKTDKNIATATDENNAQLPDRRRKSAQQYTPVTSGKDDDNTATAVKKPAEKRGRGRPRKVAVESKSDSESDFEASNTQIIKRSSRGRNRVLDSDDDEPAPHHVAAPRATSGSGGTTSEADEPRQKRSRLRRAVPAAQYAEVNEDADFEAVAATTPAVTGHYLFKTVPQDNLVVSDIEPATAAGILNPPFRKRGRLSRAVFQYAHTVVEMDTAGAASRMQAKVTAPQKELQRARSHSVTASLMGQEKSGSSTKYPRGFGPDGTIVSDLD